MSEVKSVDLVLENCEYITLNRDELYAFDVVNIKPTVSRRACNSISKYLSCDQLFVGLPDSANHTYSSLGNQSEHTIFERLTYYCDITGVNIRYENGEEDYVLVPWNENDGDNNCYQSSFLSECGWLFICVAKDLSVLQLVDTEEVDDEEHMNFLRDMYDLKQKQ